MSYERTIYRILSEQLATPIECMNRDTPIKDVVKDSLEMVEVVVHIEETLNIRLSDQLPIHTLGELIDQVDSAVSDSTSNPKSKI